MLPLTNSFIITKKDAFLLDKEALRKNTIPPIILMEESAEKITTQLKNDFRLLHKEKIAIIAGCGNNGGDALATARKLLFEGIKPKIYTLNKKNESELFKLEKNILLSLSIELLNINNLKNDIKNYTLIIDGIFGIGYSYRKDSFIEEIFNMINKNDAKVVSIDAPSGLNSESKTSIEADYTYSIGFLKKFFFNINTRKYLGKIKNLKISFDLNNIKKAQTILYYEKISSNIKNNNKFVHKYSRGSCISIGGQQGKLGSIIFCANSAFRIGCGISLIITDKKNISSINLLSKNIIADCYENYELYINKYKSIIIGPGLKLSNKKDRDIINKIINAKKQFVLDASFFSCYSKEILKSFIIPPILTPHVQEFKYFFQNEAKELNNNSIDIVSKLAVKYNSYILLKDSFLIFALPNGETIIYDNPTRILAQAGSGDILSGMIGGLLSQGYSQKDAVIESIRIFYKIAENLYNMNYISFSSDKFIDMIGTRQ